MYIVYILFSKDINRYYIGCTSTSIQDRLRRHNSNHKGFTGRSSDWSVVYEVDFNSKEEALKEEKRIKSRGAKRYLEDIER